MVEDGDTFAANAELKAVQQARHLGQWVLADDSGLAVDALDGGTGVISARYSGPGATDDSNNLKLLDRASRRAAGKAAATRFVCHICLADPSGAVAARAPPRAEDEFCRPPADKAVSATTRSLRSWNTIEALAT